jgi:hypothetical protein
MNNNNQAGQPRQVPSRKPPAGSTPFGVNGGQITQPTPVKPLDDEPESPEWKLRALDAIESATLDGELAKLFAFIDSHKSAGMPEPVVQAAASEFVEIWNSLPGVNHNRGGSLTLKRLRMLRARMNQPGDWFSDFELAAKKFPLRSTLDSSWKPNAEWMLKPDSVENILDGKYDFDKTNGRLPADSEAARANRVEQLDRKERQRLDKVEQYRLINVQRAKAGSDPLPLPTKYR